MCPGCSKFSRTLCFYFRKLVKNILVILELLYDLIKKGVTFEFDHKQTEAFELLKSKLVFVPILSLYSPGNETELYCEVSVWYCNGKSMDFPIFYFS